MTLEGSSMLEALDQSGMKLLDTEVNDSDLHIPRS